MSQNPDHSCPEELSLLGRARRKIEQEVLEIEKRTDLTKDQKVSRIINIFSATCAGIAVQPIPFADIFVLTPIQAYMGTRLAAIQGVPVKESKASDILKELAGVIGLGVLAQQLAIGAYKTFIPFLGAFTTIPMVYGLTYGIGRVMNQYFAAKARGERLSKERIKEIWEQESARGKKEGKKNASSIREESRNLSEN